MVTDVALSSQKTLFQSVGEFLIRYGLVIVLGWIGAMKFTTYEANGIEALVRSSPLMSWMYKVLSLQAASNVIGVTELAAAILIAIRPIAPRLSAIGSVLATFTFLPTLFSLFAAGLGTESWRLPCFVRFRRFSPEGRCLIGCGPIYVGRLVIFCDPHRAPEHKTSACWSCRPGESARRRVVKIRH